MSESTTKVERLDRLGEHLGVELLAARDDLLPFPLAGNKVRKLHAELDSWSELPDLVITNGGVTSNHCRTLAFLGASRGFAVHLALHGEPAPCAPSLGMLAALGATWSTGPASSIESRIEESRSQAEAAGRRVRVVPGGCHTPAGALSYRSAAEQVLKEHAPRWLLLASGTGATHGGIAAAAALLDQHPKVVGISIARTGSRGLDSVEEAAAWAGAPSGTAIDFRDDFIDGGYGCHSALTDDAVRRGWVYGLPLDPTYTGKAFAGLLAMIRTGEISPGDRVLFWHTGGLAQYLLEPGPGR